MIGRRDLRTALGLDLPKLPWWTPNRTELTMLVALVRLNMEIRDRLARIEEAIAQRPP